MMNFPWGRKICELKIYGVASIRCCLGTRYQHFDLSYDDNTQPHRLNEPRKTIDEKTI